MACGQRATRGTVVISLAGLKTVRWMKRMAVRFRLTILRRELAKAVKATGGNLQDPRVLRAAQRLDEAVVQWMRGEIRGRPGLQSPRTVPAVCSKSG